MLAADSVVTILLFTFAVTRILGGLIFNAEGPYTLLPLWNQVPTGHPYYGFGDLIP